MLEKLQSHQKAILEQAVVVSQPIVQREEVKEKRDDFETPKILEQLRQSQQSEVIRLEKLLEAEKQQRMEQEA